MILSGLSHGPFGSLSLSGHPTLREGASDAVLAQPEVSRLQQMLTTAGVQTPVTGVFDAYTKDRVMYFQRAMHLTADGVAGAATWAMLEKTVGVAVTGGDPFDLPYQDTITPQPEPAQDPTAVIQLPGVGGVSKTAIAAIGLGIAAVAVLLFVKS